MEFLLDVTFLFNFLYYVAIMVKMINYCIALWPQRIWTERDISRQRLEKWLYDCSKMYLWSEIANQIKSYIYTWRQWRQVT